MSIGSILSWIILGAIAGYLAKFIMPGRDPGGIFITILIGIVGAFIGGFLAAQLGFGGGGDPNLGGINLGSIITAVIGALILLFAFRLIRSRT